jgi:predicted Zn-dependent protease
MKSIKIGTCAIVLLTIVACTTVPLTGRSRLSLIDETGLQQEAAIGYAQFLKDPKTKVVGGNTLETQRVKRIGASISNAVSQYMTANGYGEQIKNYKWEFNLIESPEVNAWCMPGGKVAIYTGILKVTKDDAGLATVMGHEIAHAIAQHSAERASKGMAAQGLGAIVGVAAGNESETTQAVINQLYGIGAQGLVILPNSRKQELEADKMGLAFMAMAGYHPQNAIAFWQRMTEASKGTAKPPVFLSTHPADETRIAQIQKDIPEALKYYKK